MAIYSVSQVTTYLRDSLDHDLFLSDLWVSGEVSNLTHSSAGHYYFTVKDNHSQLRCVMFRNQRGGGLLTNGGAVIIHGRLSLYDIRGDLQLYVDIVQTEGIGALALKLEYLKTRLEDEGLFDPTRKRPLPTLPRKIGVATSPTGAVFHDICTVIERRYPLVEIILSPTPVQGIDAAPSIVTALQILNDLGDIDVIIIARGGGSIEELWPFNEEVVVRAIHGSRVPVISGVGHDTNTTLSDLVADQMAPTPSAAAEVAVPDVIQLKMRVAAHRSLAISAITRSLSESQQVLDGITDRLTRTTPQIDFLQERTSDLARKLSRSMLTYTTLAGEHFRGVEQRLSNLNPQAVLTRGYAVVQSTKDARLITKKGQISKDDSLMITVSDGSFETRAV